MDKKEIASALESSIGELYERDNIVSPDAALVELFDIVNSKLSINLAVLDVVLYASMIVSAERKDYSLPKPWTDCGMGVMRKTMDGRSLSTTMAFQGHREVFLSPDSYIDTNRPDGVFDGLILPQDVFK